MNNNSEAIKNRLGIIFIWMFVILLFGSISVMVAIGFARNSFVKKYTLSVGNCLIGNSLVYSEHDEEIFLLDRNNVASIAKISASGSIIWGSHADETTGNKITLTSIPKDGGERMYMCIEETVSGRTKVTIDDGETTMDAYLNDVKYSNFLKCARAKGPNGENRPVDAIPE